MVKKMIRVEIRGHDKLELPESVMKNKYSSEKKGIS